MEAPAANSPSPLGAGLDPGALTEKRRCIRSNYKPLDILQELYNRNHLRTLALNQAAAEQVEAIQTHRAGDLIVIGYDPAHEETTIKCQCCCGVFFDLHKRSVQRHLIGPGTNAYFAPVGVSHAFPAPMEALTRYACPHIEKQLSGAYPQHYAAWQGMKKQVQTRVKMYPASLMRMTIEPAWFDKATGFAEFILATGLPNSEGLGLRKKGNAGQFGLGEYSWADASPMNSARAAYPDLARRYYALRAHAKKTDRYFAWEDFTIFVHDVTPPDTFNQEPAKWRLRWKSAAVNGYRPGNFYWDRVKQLDHSQQPWNRIAVEETLSQEIPLAEYGVTLEQYMEGLIRLGMMIFDPGRTAESMEDMVREAMETAKGNI